VSVLRTLRCVRSLYICRSKRASKRPRLPAAVHLLVCALVFAATLAAISPLALARAPQSLGLTVTVRTESGDSLDTVAVTITLSKSSGEMLASGSAFSGRAEFGNLAPGSYTVTASAPLFHSASQTVDLLLSSPNEQVELILRPQRDSTASRSASSGLLLSPKLRKELASALDALRANKLDAAKKHVDAAFRLAPANPDVNFVRGLYFARAGEASAARESWQKSISVDPKYTPAMLQLGTLALKSGNYTDARDFFSATLNVNPNSWRAHELLAVTLLRLHKFPEAAREAELTLRFGHQQAIGANLILAEADLEQQKLANAREALRALLTSHPSSEQAAAATRLLQFIDQASATPAHGAASQFAAQVLPPSPLDSSAAESSAPSPQYVEAAAPSAPSSLDPLPAVAETAVPVDSVNPASWLPPSVSETFPPVDSTPPCVLPELLIATAQRVDDFVSSLDRFTATEDLHHELLSPWGAPLAQENRSFRYTAFVTRLQNGAFAIQEMRNGTPDLSIFPDRLATIGLPAAIFIFHSQFQGDYEMTCEGLSRPLASGGTSPSPAANSTPAWQIYFRQKAGRPSRIRGYRVSLSAPVVGVPLEGRAWIDAATSNVIRIETDLLVPVPQIQLAAEHQLIEFAPVRFASRETELWLPKSAEIFWELRGRRYHRKNTFRDFLLFSVDEKQTIAEPKRKDKAEDTQTQSTSASATTHQK
jgi:tetratricopeptide (TPR) repeat protein